MMTLGVDSGGEGGSGEKRYVHTLIADLHCCTAEMNTTL